MSYNKKLATWLKPNPEPKAGINNIQIPGEVEHVIWQTRDHEPTQYELDLVDVLIKGFDSGITELEEIVAFINDAGVYDAEGNLWTTESFEREMARFGH